MNEYKLIDNTIYIVSDETKKQMLRNNKEVLKIKFYTKDSFIKKLLFNYDEKTINYIMENYNYNYINSKIILENMLYLKLDFEFKNDKILFLLKLYNELLDKKLLLIDDNFNNFSKNFNIVVKNYNYIDSILEYSLNQYDRYNIDIKLEHNNSIKEYLEFENYDDEVNYCFEEISLLIDKKISLKNIKIVIPDDKYLYYINKYSLLFGIKFPTKLMLNTTKEAIKFLELIKANTSFENSINYLKEEGYDKNVLNKIIQIINIYYNYNLDTKKLYDRFKYHFKTNINDEIKYDNQLEIINLDNYVPNSDEYIFILGFNEGKYPKSKKDDDYFSNNEKEQIGINTADEIYNLELECIYNKILNIKNVFISYPKNYKNEVLYSHSFFDKENFKLKEKEIKNYTYSKKSSILYLASYYDDYYKYNIITSKLIQLHNSFNILYNIYDNKFNKLSVNQIETLKNKTMYLSYTKIDTFYKCRFAYYLKYILKIDKFETNFSANIGNLYHEVLKNYYNDNFDIEQEINDFINNIVFNKQEIILLKKIIEILKETIEILTEEELEINYNDKKTEFKYEIKIDELTTFVGIIDKIYSNEENDVVIVDYKTGKNNIDYKNIKYGLDLQLFVYIYLLKKSENNSNLNIVGFYLQYLMDFDYNYNDSKTKKIRNFDSMKLCGYSIDDVEKLEQFDNSLEKSKIIKGMKLKKDGQFYSNCKILSKDLIDDSVEIVQNHINFANEKIRAAEFDIDPKKNNSKNVSCTYCEFKDVCFVTYNDLIDLDILKEE